MEEGQEGVVGEWKSRVQDFRRGCEGLARILDQASSEISEYGYRAFGAGGCSYLDENVLFSIISRELVFISTVPSIRLDWC